VNDDYAPNVFGETPDKVVVRGGITYRSFNYAMWINDMLKVLYVKTKAEELYQYD